MGETTFEAALAGRVGDILDACTRCGKCFEVCPITEAAKIADASPVAVLDGVMDILRTGNGPAASRQWASGWDANTSSRIAVSAAAFAACFAGSAPHAGQYWCGGIRLPGCWALA